MDKKSIKDFFDACASSWDNNTVKDDMIINKILDNAKMSKGESVLDVACGTGIMIPYYLKRGLIPCGIDISNKMIEIAHHKFKDVEFICEDVETFTGRKFDHIVIYNAFPHFIDPDKLIKHLTNLLNKKGTLTIAHGQSRHNINKHHMDKAISISRKLLEASELNKIMSQYLNVYLMIDDDKMYELCGILK